MKLIKKLMCIFLCAATMLSMTACGNSSAYKKAVSLYEQGKYDQAILKFAELGDYKDSLTYKEQCKKETAKLLQGEWIVYGKGTSMGGHALAFEGNEAALAFFMDGEVWINSTGKFEITDDARIHLKFTSDEYRTFKAENGKIHIYSGLGDEYTLLE